MRKRNNRIVFYLNDKELNMLEAKISKTGLTREAFLRALIADRQVKELPPADYFEVLKYLRLINSNMNQIAVRANYIGLIDADEYRRNVYMLQEAVGKLIREAYG